VLHQFEHGLEETMNDDMYMYNTRASFTTSKTLTKGTSPFCGRRNSGRKLNSEDSGSFSVPRSENETPACALLSHEIDDSRERVRKCCDERTSPISNKFVTPLHDRRQSECASVATIPLVSRNEVSQQSWDSGKKATSNNHERLIRIHQLHGSAACNTELDEVLSRVEKPLWKQKLKSRKKTLGRLINPFCKDQNRSHALSAPGSTLSKRSVKSFEVEYFNAGRATVGKNRHTVLRRNVYPETSEAQQRRWLLQVHRAIRDSAVREVIVRSAAQQETLRSMQIEETCTLGSKFSRDSSSESGVFEEPTLLFPSAANVEYHASNSERSLRKPYYYGANPTSDDEQSVSSMELLFNWLTCRDDQLDDRQFSRRDYNYDSQTGGLEFDLETTSTDPYTQKKPIGFCR
jgi:hypothetical protein